MFVRFSHPKGKNGGGGALLHPPHFICFEGWHLTNRVDAIALFTTFNDKLPPNWVAVCFARYGILSEEPEGCRSAKFMTTTHTTSPPILRIAIL